MILVDSETGEVFVQAGEIITEEVAEDIQNSGINIVDILVGDKKSQSYRKWYSKCTQSFTKC